VDDIPSTLNNLQILLSFEPDIAVVGTAPNGKVAIEWARVLLPNAVVMGIHMPGMDGFQATEALAQEIPNARVITMSAGSNTPDGLGRSWRAGALDFLSKPFSGDELINSIRFLCNVCDDRDVALFRSIGRSGDSMDGAQYASQSGAARLTAWKTLVHARYTSAWARQCRADVALITDTGGLENAEVVANARTWQLDADEATQTATHAWEIAQRTVSGLIDPAVAYKQYVTAADAHKLAKAAAEKAGRARATLVPNGGKTATHEPAPATPTETPAKGLIVEDNPAFEAKWPGTVSANQQIGDLSALPILMKAAVHYRILKEQGETLNDMDPDGIRHTAEEALDVYLRPPRLALTGDVRSRLLDRLLADILMARPQAVQTPFKPSRTNVEPSEAAQRETARITKKSAGASSEKSHKGWILARGGERKVGKDSFYDKVRNKFDRHIYHVSTMQNPVFGYWETAVFSDPGPAFGGDLKRGDTILTPEFVRTAPVSGPREEGLADLARRGPKDAHKLVRNRVANEDPSKWTMTSDELERQKQFVLDFMDRRQAK
jgi:CheY-like chemotaxis protein